MEIPANFRWAGWDGGAAGVTVGMGRFPYRNGDYGHLTCAPGGVPVSWEK